MKITYCWDMASVSTPAAALVTERAAEVAAEVAAFRWVADKAYSAMLARGKFNWNQFLNNDPNCPACGNCPAPWVRQASCAADLREHCNATGPVHTRAMHYGIRGCGVHEPPWTSTANAKNATTEKRNARRAVLPRGAGLLSSSS